MPESRRYTSGTALRTALEERPKRIARGESIDLQRLRRQVAFDRFLARLFYSGRTDWILKGGYAMQLRFNKARTTKDLDFTVRNRPVGEGDSVLALLQEVGAAEIADWFNFRISEATTDLDGAPYGGSRYPCAGVVGGAYFREVPR